MNRRFCAFAATGLLVLVAGNALAFTRLDDADAVALVGPGLVPPTGDQQGGWQTAKGLLSLTKLHPSGHQVWLAPAASATIKDGSATIKDGFVRLRLGLPLSGKVSLLLRVPSPSADSTRLSGYAVQVSRTDLSLVRWDKGQARPLDRSVKLAKAPKLTEIDLEVWLVGPHLAAHAIDPGTLDVLASATVSDSLFRSGRIGVLATTRSLPGTPIRRLTVRNAGGGGPSGKTEPQGQAEPQGHAEQQGQREPAGMLRVVRLHATVAAALVPVLRPLVTEVDRPTAAAVDFLATPKSIEHLRRAGVALQALDVDLPFRYLDPGVRRRRHLTLDVAVASWLQDGGHADPPLVEALLRHWHRSYPAITRLRELGRTAQGRPLLALLITDRPDAPEPEPSLLLNATHHGDEALSTSIALDAGQQLLEGYGADARTTAWVDGLRIWLVPLVNPDGAHQFFEASSWVGRKNARDVDGDGVIAGGEGVDLNRNYPFLWAGLGELGSRSAPGDAWFRGPRPGSEAETQAMMALADTEHFVASLSLHTNGTVILAPYTIDGVENPEANEAWQLAVRMAQASPVQPNGRRFRVKRKMYSVDGVDQDWLRAAHGTAALLVEAALHNPIDLETQRKSVLALRPTWATLLTAVLDGPAISGTVLDARGVATVADVVVQEQAPRNGERWQSRCRDGRFDRLVSLPGPYTLRVTVPGRVPVDVPVLVPVQGRAEVTVRLPFAAPDPPVICPVAALCSDLARCAQILQRCPDAVQAVDCKPALKPAPTRP